MLPRKVKGKKRGPLQGTDSDTSESTKEVTVRERDCASTLLPSSDLGYGTAPDLSLWTAEASGISVVETGIQTRAQKLHQALNPIKHLVICRTEPGSPILVSVIWSDLDVTIFQEEAETLGFQVCVEDIDSRESENEKSDDPYYDSISGPATMASPAGLDDLIVAMRDMMHIQMQQMAQTTQLQQQLAVQQMNPPVVGPGMQPPVRRPGPQVGVMKIRPTLPIFDGSGDVDDHLELFLSIANAEG